MPQMMPMNWPILYLMTIMTFILFIQVNFYSKLKTWPEKEIKYIKKSPMNWMW